MLIAFPAIPVPSVPKIPVPTGIQEGSSVSSSKVTTCVNGKCTSEEQTSTGSSMLKVTTVAKDDLVTTTVIKDAEPEKVIPIIVVDNEVQKVKNKIRDYLTKLHQRLIHFFAQ
jgi:hypothetical protein